VSSVDFIITRDLMNDDDNNNNN